MSKSEKSDEEETLVGLFRSAIVKKDRSIRVYVDTEGSEWLLLNDAIRVLDLDIKKVEEAVALLHSSDKKRFDLEGRTNLPGIGVSAMALRDILIHANYPYSKNFIQWISHVVFPLILKNAPGAFTTPQFDELSAFSATVVECLDQMIMKETPELRNVIRTGTPFLCRAGLK